MFKAIIIVSILLCTLWTSASAAVLGPNSTIILGRTLAEHQSIVQIELAIHPGRMQSALTQLHALGATIRYSDSTVGYIRALVPVQRLVGHLDFGPDVDAAAIFTSNQFDTELHSPEITKEARSDAPSNSTNAPAFDPAFAGPQYTGAPPMGADVFKREHPTFDGRGVTIGFMEPIDPQAPGLQVAYDLNGKPVRKVIDFLSPAGPFEPQNGGAPLNRNYGWIDMRTTVHARDGHVQFNGRSYTTPYDGTFSIGTFYGGVFFVHYVKSTRSKSSNFTVLWDRRRGKVWFDTRQDGGFERDHPVSNYARSGDVFSLPLHIPSAHAGNLPALNTQKTVRFVLNDDLYPNFLRVFVLGVSLHPAMVGSSAAGNRMFGGRMDGIAPGARILASEDQLPMMIELILQLIHHHADIISSQYDQKFADQGAENVWDLIIGRIAHRYGTIFTWAVSNRGPAIGSIYPAASASSVFGIGGYLSRESERLNDGVDFEGEAPYSGRGPLLDGALKPDLLAPTQWLADGSMDGTPTLLAGKFLLPAGYAVGGGTSQASPTAAGAIALLLSAAKQTGLNYTFDSLRRSIFSSAKVVEGLPIDEGYGLINVPAAWKMLQEQPNTTVRLSGDPFYDRDVTPGVSSVYDITATSSATVAVRIDWLGSSGGTIEQPSTTFEANVPSHIRVHLAEMRAGEMRSGLIEIRDASSGMLLASRPITQIAPYQFNVTNTYMVTARGTLTHPGGTRFFFRVPANVRALTLRLHEGVTGPGWSSKVRRELARWNPLLIIQPDGFMSPIADARAPASNDGNFTIAIAHPIPGTWQIALDGGDAAIIPELAGAGTIPVSPVTLSAAIYGVTLEGCTLDKSGKTCRFHNRFAPFKIQTATVPTPQRSIKSVTLRPGKLLQTIDFYVRDPRVKELHVAIAGKEAGNIGRDLFYCLTAPPTIPYPQGPWYRGSCFFRAHAEGNAILNSALPTGSGTTFDDRDDVQLGRWVVAVYPIHGLSLLQRVTAVVDKIDLASTPVTTVPETSYVGISETFTVRVRSATRIVDPTVESPQVYGQYQPNVTIAGGYSGKNQKQPILRELVPL